MTTMDKKVTILKKLQTSGENLDMIGLEYKEYYEEDLNRPDIAGDFSKGLLQIIKFMLKEKI